MQFIDCVNRILRVSGLIRGDTDPLTSFTDTAHNSSSQIAQIAIQQEISSLSALGLLPYQRTLAATITLVTSTRAYAVASDFIQFWGDPPFLYDATANIQIFEYPGGEAQLRKDIMDYKTQTGTPLWWYWEPSTTQKIGMFPVPDSGANGKVYTYDYEAEVQVSSSTDTIPLSTTDQQYAFTDCAARRFKYLFEGKIDTPITDDQIYRDAKSTLIALIKGRQPAQRYGSVYK